MLKEDKEIKEQFRRYVLGDNKMRLSTTLEMTKEIHDKLYMETRSHKSNCICTLCELDKIIKNEMPENDNHNKDSESEIESNKYVLELQTLREPQFEVVDMQKKEKLGLVNCPFCGPQLVSKLVKKYDRYIKNEYVLDCGHYVYIKEDFILKNDEDSNEDVFKKWRKENPFSSDIEWCKKNPRLIGIVRDIENREKQIAI